MHYLGLSKILSHYKYDFCESICNYNERLFFFDKTMRGSVPLYRKQSDQKCLSELTVVAEAPFLHKSN